MLWDCLFFVFVLRYVVLVFLTAFMFPMITGHPLFCFAFFLSTQLESVDKQQFRMFRKIRGNAGWVRVKGLS